MKTFISKVIKNHPSIITIIIGLFTLTSCGSYYKVQTSHQQFSKEQLKYLIQKDKYFILHDADTAFCLSNISFNDTSFSGKLSPLPKVHLKYKTEKGNFRYKNDGYSNEEEPILNEVHLYLKNDIKIKDQFTTAKYFSVIKLEINSKDRTKSTSTWIIPLAIIIPVAIIIVTSLSLAFKNMGVPINNPINLGM
jgi:hypothetical protein